MVQFEKVIDFSKSIRDANTFSDSIMKMRKNIFGSKTSLEGMQKSLKESAQQYKLMGHSAKEIAAFNQDMGIKLQTVEWNLKDINEQQEAFDELVSHGGDKISEVVGRLPLIGSLLAPAFQTPLSRLSQLSQSMGNFNKSFSTLTKNGRAMDSVFGDFFKNFAGNITAFGSNFKTVFSGGVTAMLSNIPTIFSAIATSIGSLIPVIASIALPIGIVIAAVFTLYKIWQLNVGGIQKLVFGVGGAIKDVLGRALLHFQTLLIKLGPVLKIVFTPIFTVLKGLVVIVGAVFDAIFAILDPLFDAISEIFAPFADAQGTAFDLVDVFKVLGNVIGWIGKILGFVVKVAIFPLVLYFRILAKIGEFIGHKILDMGKAFMKLTWVQKMFHAIGEAISFVKDMLDAMLAPFKWIWETAKKVGEYLGFGKTTEVTPGQQPGTSAVERPATTITNSSSRVVNSSPSISIQTSREITPQGARGFAEMLTGQLETQATQR